MNDSNARINEHRKAIEGADRPPVPVDPTNRQAEDTQAWERWRQSAPRRLNAPGQDLRGVRARGRDLRFAGLQGADLREADLRNADLRGADLRNARLEGANLVGARMDSSTRLGGVDLGEGLANRSSAAVLLEALNDDPDAIQMRAMTDRLHELAAAGGR